MFCQITVTITQKDVIPAQFISSSYFSIPNEHTCISLSFQFLHFPVSKRDFQSSRLHSENYILLDFKENTDFIQATPEFKCSSAKCKRLTVRVRVSMTNMLSNSYGKPSYASIFISANTIAVQISNKLAASQFVIKKLNTSVLIYLAS